MSSQGRPVRHHSSPSAIVTSAGSSVSPSPRAEESKKVGKSVRTLVKPPTNIDHDHSQVDDSPSNRPEPRRSSTEPCSPIPNSRNSNDCFFTSSDRLCDAPKEMSSHSISSSEPYANRNGFIKRVPSFVPHVSFLRALPPSSPLSHRSDDAATQPYTRPSTPSVGFTTGQSVTQTLRHPKPLARQHPHFFAPSVQQLAA